jgi:hypothetical protein
MNALLFWKTFCSHNIEFSCAAASAKTTASMDRRSICRHNLRRQLQRFVMNTIRVMACPVRAKLTAPAIKATTGKHLSVLRSERQYRLFPADSLLHQRFPIQTREHPIPADYAHAITWDSIGGPLSSLLCASLPPWGTRWRGGNSPNSNTQRSDSKTALFKFSDS